MKEFELIDTIDDIEMTLAQAEQILCVLSEYFPDVLDEASQSRLIADYPKIPLLMVLVRQLLNATREKASEATGNPCTTVVL